MWRLACGVCHDTSLPAPTAESHYFRVLSRTGATADPSTRRIARARAVEEKVRLEALKEAAEKAWIENPGEAQMAQKEVGDEEAEQGDHPISISAGFFKYLNEQVATGNNLVDDTDCINWKHEILTDFNYKQV